MDQNIQLDDHLSLHFNTANLVIQRNYVGTYSESSQIGIHQSKPQLSNHPENNTDLIISFTTNISAALISGLKRSNYEL